MFVSGCVDSDEPVPAGADASLSAGWQNLFAADATDPLPLSPVSLPADLQTHSTARAESFSARAVVFDQQRQAFSVYAQWERLRIRDTATDTPAASQWAYDSVFRALTSIGADADDSATSHELIERGALGLAGSDVHRFFVGKNSVLLKPDVSSQTPCMAQVHLAVMMNPEHETSLESTSPVCATGESVGSVLNQWEAPAVPVSGTVLGQLVEGFAWLTHSWGHPAPTSGAVVLDQLRLRLVPENGDVFHLNANRSRRRSGTGPVSVLASITDASGARTEIDLQWQDHSYPPSVAAGIDYATEFQLQSLALGLDVTLAPIVPNSEVRDVLGSRWRGGVLVSGTHDGVGFVDVVPSGKGNP